MPIIRPPPPLPPRPTHEEKDDEDTAIRSTRQPTATSEDQVGDRTGSAEAGKDDDAAASLGDKELRTSAGEELEDQDKTKSETPQDEEKGGSRATAGEEQAGTKPDEKLEDEVEKTAAEPDKEKAEETATKEEQ